MNAIFEPTRFVNLEKQSFFFSKNQLLYIICILASLYVLSAALYYLTNTSLITIMFFVCKLIIVVSPCFLEKNVNKNSSIFDFMLPASTFEKFISVLVKYLIAVPLVCFATIAIMNLLGSIIPIEAINEHVKYASLSNILTFDGLRGIIALQSVFLLGSFYFRRHAFAKTTLTILIGLLTIFILGTIIVALIISNYDSVNSNQEINLDLESVITSELTLDFNGFNTTNISKFILNIIFPVGLWVVSYFKLRETEI